MAARIAFTIPEIRKLDPAACDDDPRFAWRDGDRCNVGIFDPRDSGDLEKLYTNLPSMNPRQIRSMALQMLRHVENMEHEESKTEIVF